jgi:hypothetical protein
VVEAIPRTEGRGWYAPIVEGHPHEANEVATSATRLASPSAPDRSDSPIHRAAAVARARGDLVTVEILGWSW